MENDNPITETAVLRKIAWRLIPFLGLLYLLAFLDRVNVGFAALTMNVDLGFTASVFGRGAGIFFLGYVLCGVPSNLVLHEVGARRWIGSTMIIWGIVSGAMAFIHTPIQFYVLRFVLGMAESGFFPGMILYLTYWFPREHRSRILGAFMVALPLSSVIGAPISTTVLDLTAYGLQGWQWLFLLEGIPAAIVGAITLKYLVDRPDRASWLTPSEIAILNEALQGSADQSISRVRDALTHPEVWLLSTVYFALLVALYTYGFWLPQFIQALGRLTHQQIGGLAMLPNLAAALLMYGWARHSDRRGERLWHVALPLMLAAVGLALTAYVNEASWSLFALTLAALGIYCALPVFWTLSTNHLSGASAAAGIALINSVGNIGGYVGPSIMGYLRQATHAYTEGLVLLAGSVALAAGLLICTNSES